MIDNEVIRNQSARAFSLIIALERDEWSNALSDVSQMLATSIAVPFQAIGLLSILGELLKIEFFEIELKTPGLMEGYSKLWVQCLGLIAETQAVDMDLRILVAECVCDSLKRIPEFCSAGGVPDVDRIKAVLAVLPPSLMLQNVKLFESCHRIMLNVVEVYYVKSQEFIDLIKEYVNQTLQLTAPELKQFRAFGILFWKEVAEFEHGIAEQEREARSGGGRHRWLSASVASTLLPLFFDIMCRINPADTRVDDSNEQSVDDFAMEAIRAFYNLTPVAVFDTFIQPTFEASIGSAAWTVRRAAILLLYCMCPIGDWRHLATQWENQFLWQHMPDVLVACRTEAIPRLTETALFVLAMILSHFPEMLTSGNICTNPTAVVEQIVDLVRPDEISHALIFSGINLIICRAFSNASWGC
jgi:hypothetical protein